MSPWEGANGSLGPLLELREVSLVWTAGDSAEPERLLEALELRPRLRRDAEFVLHELLSNASRESIQSADVRVGLGLDDLGLDLVVESPSAPAVSRCLQAIQRAVRDQGAPLAGPSPGAGIGLYLFWRRCSRLLLQDRGGVFRVAAHLGREVREEPTLVWRAG